VFGEPSLWSASTVYTLGPIVAGLDAAELKSLKAPEGVSPSAVHAMDAATLLLLDSRSLAHFPQEAIAQKEQRVASIKEKEETEKLFSKLSRFFDGRVKEMVQAPREENASEEPTDAAAGGKAAIPFLVLVALTVAYICSY